jgi:hypothetical protein
MLTRVMNQAQTEYSVSIGKPISTRREYTQLFTMSKVLKEGDNFELLLYQNFLDKLEPEEKNFMNVNINVPMYDIAVRAHLTFPEVPMITLKYGNYELPTFNQIEFKDNKDSEPFKVCPNYTDCQEEL